MIYLHIFVLNFCDSHVLTLVQMLVILGHSYDKRDIVSCMWQLYMTEVHLHIMKCREYIEKK